MHTCMSSEGKRNVSLQTKLINLHTNDDIAGTGVKPVWAAALLLKHAFLQGTDPPGTWIQSG